MNWAEHFKQVSQRSAFGASIGDVLGYRNLWNDYVMNTARALVACANAWDAAATAKAANQALPDGPNYGRLSEAAQQDAASYKAIADSDRQYAQDLVNSWNQHAGMTEQDMLLQSSNILKDFQDTVLRTGQFYQDQVKQDCPNIALPQPPSSDLQKSIIGQLQGAGLATQGILQLLGTGVDGSLQAAGAIATLNPSAFPGAKDLAKNLAPWMPSKTTLIIGGVLGVTGLIVLAKILK